MQFGTSAVHVTVRNLLSLHSSIQRIRRARSSRCCGLSSVEYHGSEGKKKGGHSNWRKLLWRFASLTGKVCKS